MKHIIIVDDALDLGRVLQTMLLTLGPGLIIHVVPSAEEAMLETGKHPVDLLVTDIRLPGMTGLDLIRKIRARQPELNTIIITGIADERQIQLAREIKPAALMRKPLDFPLFLEKSRALLGLAAAKIHSAAAPAPTVPLSPPAILPPARPLFELASNLRETLAALTVLILDERGRVLIQDGESLPSGLASAYPAAIVASLSAAEKISSLVGPSPLQHVQVFSGPAFSLVVAPVGEYSLMVVLRKGRSALHVSLAVEETLAVQLELAAALKAAAPAAAPEKTSVSPAAAAPAAAPAGLPAPQKPPTGPFGMSVRPSPPPAVVQPPAAPVIPPLPPPPAVPEPEPGPELKELEDMFQQTSTRLQPDEVNAYWDSLLETGPAASTNPNDLNYSQAADLGLAPSLPPDPEK